MASIAARAGNAVPAVILRSPFHAVMSHKYAIIEFTGRKSGRRYTTPVAYVRDGDTVLLSTDSPWWRNLRGGAPVRLRLQGRTVTGTATAATDAAQSSAVIRRLVDEIRSYARLAGIRREGGRVSDADVDRAVAAGRVGIDVVLEETK